MTAAESLSRPRIRAYYPLFCTGTGISRVLLEFGDRVESDHFDFEYTTVGVTPHVRRNYHHTPLPAALPRLAFRFLRRPQKVLLPLLEAAFQVMWDHDFIPLISLKVFDAESFASYQERGFSFYRKVAAEGIVL